MDLAIQPGHKEKPPFLFFSLFNLFAFLVPREAVPRRLKAKLQQPQ
jgi:hypothetical protein